MIRLPIPFGSLHGADFAWGAHHPHCDRHDAHLLWVGKHPLCLGCTCLYLGSGFGALAAVAFPIANLSFFYWTGIHLLLVAPSTAQPWIQAKLYKIAARLALGGAAGSYVLTGLFQTHFLVSSIWAWRGLVILALLVVAKLLLTLRARKPADPCSACPLGRYPTCDWNLPRLLSVNPQLQQTQAVTLHS